MYDWWQSLPVEAQAFYAIALLSTAALLIQSLMMMIGVDDLHVGDVDMGGADLHSAGLHLLSVRTIVAFGVGFGWAGVCVLHAGGGLMLAVPIALACGCMLMFGVFWLMRSMARLTSSGTLDYRNAIGQMGSVYIPIPANLGGNGQIEISVQGRVMTVQACTRASRPLPGQSKVRVVELLDRTTLIVEPIAH